MSNAEHADLEAISAYVDGEAPEWADHVAGCASCRATAAQLRAVAVAVGRPVDNPSTADRERSIAAALDAVPDQPAPARHDVHRARFARRRPARPWAMPAVAAVIVGLLGLSGLVLSSYRTQDETTTVAGPTTGTDVKADSLESGGGGVAAAAPSAPPADLGDLPDAATLRARALPTLGAAASTGRASSSASSGASSNAATEAPAGSGTGVASGSGGAGGSASVQTPTTTLTQRVAPSVVGTRPCEEQARTREPTLGPVVYFATARQGPVAGYVLGFAPVGSTSSTPVILLLLAQDGCAELLRAAVP